MTTRKYRHPSPTRKHRATTPERRHAARRRTTVRDALPRLQGRVKALSDSTSLAPRTVHTGHRHSDPRKKHDKPPSLRDKPRHRDNSLKRKSPRRSPSRRKRSSSTKRTSTPKKSETRKKSETPKKAKKKSDITVSIPRNMLEELVTSLRSVLQERDEQLDKMDSQSELQASRIQKLESAVAELSVEKQVLRDMMRSDNGSKDIATIKCELEIERRRNHVLSQKLEDMERRTARSYTSTSSGTIFTTRTPPNRRSRRK